MFKSTTFIAFRGFFLGALFSQLESAYEKGNLDLSAKAIIHMCLGAAIAAGFSLWHLYLPSPNGLLVSNQTGTTKVEPQQKP
jgi:hypothetical protein